MVNVNHLTDEQIYEILDIQQPTDRELEMAILQRIRQHENDSELSAFFTSIYTRFFEVDDEDDTASEESEPFSFVKPQTEIEGFTNFNIPPVPQSQPPPQIPNDDPPINTTLITNQVRYTRDYMNPLLKQTTTRIISIDSQYRDDKTSTSTDLTFNLSQPLLNVVSLNLNTIHIPYSWYTVSTNYGSNFFLLRGNTTGIQGARDEYQIEIPPGIYTGNTLTQAVNQSISLLSTEYPEINFGNTSLQYNETNQLITFYTDIQKIYNESNFKLMFDVPPEPNITGNIYTDIGSFLGYNSQYYSLSSIYSMRTLPPIATTTSADTTNSTYYVDISNNFFTLFQYIPAYFTEPFDYQRAIQDTTYATAFPITLSNITLNSKSTRQQLVTEVGTQIATHSSLSSSESFLTRIDITEPTAINVGKSYFELSTVLTPALRNRFENAKLAIVFPDDSTYNSPVWIGLNSCFQFDTSINIVAPVAETSLVETEYNIAEQTPTICIICNTENFRDNSLNSYQIPISSNTLNTLTGLLSLLNTSITTVNQTTVNSYNPTGDFNIPSGTDNTLFSFTNVKINADSLIEFQFDITHNFTYRDYFLQIPNSTILFTLLSPSLGNIDLSSSNVLSATSIIQQGYTIPGNTLLATLIPKPDTGNASDPIFEIYSPSETQSVISYSRVIDVVNQAFLDFTTDAGISNPLRGTTLQIVPTSGTEFTSTLTVIVNRTLTEKNYSIGFTDNSGNQLGYSGLNSIWTKLGFQYYSYAGNTWFGDYANTSLYNFTTDASSNQGSYSNIISTANIGAKKLLLTESTNQFYLVPLTTPINTLLSIPIQINLSLGTVEGSYWSFTTSKLFQAIREYFDNSPVLIGSNIDAIEHNGNNFTRLNLNVNVKFETPDYEIVFYDSTRFYDCGTTNGLSPARWDTTLGWLMGFREQRSYSLRDFTPVSPINSRMATQITGNTPVNLNLYSYFMIILDDYNQNHLNDGVITLSGKEFNNPLPSYGSKIYCNDTNVESIVPSINETTTGNQLTQKQVYALQEIYNSQIESNANASKSFTPGIYLKDVFGLIPLELRGLNYGDNVVMNASEFENQKRSYFGPVNLYRISVRLVNDRGDVVNLNGKDWSFTIICEQLYNNTK